MTRVLFPRFEYETPEKGDIAQRKVSYKAQARPWLTPEEVAGVGVPKTITEENIIKNALGNWWGVHHTIRERVTVGRLFEVPFGGDPTPLFRTRILTHNHQWDRQAMEGVSHEVILEKLVLSGEPPFNERAAMLVPVHRSRDGDFLQRFLIKNETGGWIEPDFGGVDDLRDFYLLLIDELINREGYDHYSSPLKPASEVA